MLYLDKYNDVSPLSSGFLLHRFVEVAQSFVTSHRVGIFFFFIEPSL